MSGTARTEEKSKLQGQSILERMSKKGVTCGSIWDMYCFVRKNPDMVCCFTKDKSSGLLRSDIDGLKNDLNDLLKECDNILSVEKELAIEKYHRLEASYQSLCVRKEELIAVYPYYFGKGPKDPHVTSLLQEFEKQLDAFFPFKIIESKIAEIYEKHREQWLTDDSIFLTDEELNALSPAMIEKTEYHPSKPVSRKFATVPTKPVQVSERKGPADLSSRTVVSWHNPRGLCSQSSTGVINHFFCEETSYGFMFCMDDIDNAVLKEEDTGSVVSDEDVGDVQEDSIARPSSCACMSDGDCRSSSFLSRYL